MKALVVSRVNCRAGCWISSIWWSSVRAFPPRRFRFVTRNAPALKLSAKWNWLRDICKGGSLRSPARMARRRPQSLIGELLKDAGLPTLVGGNIGTPLISLVDSSRDDGWTVVEMSSFQLETIKEFHPTVAVVLNVTPNHMDRYESFTDYAAAKHRIFMNQEPGDVAILNADDEIVSSWAKGLRAHVAEFSVKRELEEGLFLRGRELVSRARDGERVLLTSDEMKLRGPHNVENVLAALAAGLACGAAPDSMRETVQEL